MFGFCDIFFASKKSMDDHFVNTKQSVLDHISQLFEEMEQEMAMSHQEKYALLEDAFESASDVDELRVAFEQWYHDHADDVEFEHEVAELWDHACTKGEDDDDGELEAGEVETEDEEEEPEME